MTKARQSWMIFGTIIYPPLPPKKTNTKTKAKKPKQTDKWLCFIYHILQIYL